jgi:predicted ATP-binding protein involved in virulence
MQLSRVEKYKKRKFYLLLYSKKKKTLKVFTLTIGIGIALVTTNNLAFANTGISQILQKWYVEKLHSVEENLSDSILAETNNQKAVLLHSITDQTKDSIKELQKFAKEQENIINQRIKNKAEETAKVIQEKNTSEIEKQKELIKNNLEETLSAQDKTIKEVESAPAPELPNKAGTSGGEEVGKNSK